MLADARAVEYLARALLADARGDLALYDARTPSNMTRLGYGKGLLTTRIAASEARGAQLAMEYGEDAGVANRRLRLAKRAFVLAEDLAARAKIMAAVQGRTQRSRLQQMEDAD